MGAAAECRVPLRVTMVSKVVLFLRVDNENMGWLC